MEGSKGLANSMEIQCVHRKRIILVANVAKEHVLKFHVPTIKALKEQGWYVDVACAGEDEVPYCDHQYHMSYKRSPFVTDTLKGIRELKTVIDNGNYDVVYCHTPVGGLAGRLASIDARKKGTKVIYFAHGFHFYRGAPKKNWVIYFPVEKALAKLTDKMITINSEDYNNAINLLGCKHVIQLNGMGIDLDSFFSVDKKTERKKIRCELNIPQDAWVMIYLAELIPNKNQKMLLDTLKLVLKRQPNAYLILAGIDHYQGKIQKYAKEIGVFDHLRYLGWRSDKEALYASADICTATSIREGFGLNLVEAMASGLPIVATCNRGHRTIVKNGENGYLVEIGDSEEMADKIYDLMSGKSKLFKDSSDDLKKYDQQQIIERVIAYVSEQD